MLSFTRVYCLTLIKTTIWTQSKKIKQPISFLNFKLLSMMFKTLTFAMFAIIVFDANADQTHMLKSVKCFASPRFLKVDECKIKVQSRNSSSFSLKATALQPASKPIYVRHFLKFKFISTLKSAALGSIHKKFSLRNDHSRNLQKSTGRMVLNDGWIRKKSFTAISG